MSTLLYCLGGLWPFIDPKVWGVDWLYRRHAHSRLDARITRGFMNGEHGYRDLGDFEKINRAVKALDASKIHIGV